MIKQLLSYDTILNDKDSFRKSRLDVLDAPGTYFFKVIFYFNNPGDDSDTGYTSNLLGWSNGMTDGGVWTGEGKPDLKESASHTLETDNIGAQFGSQPAAVSYNTAYNYLCMNGEWERAKNLKDFIFMLSEISANEPWYFKSIEGLDTAMERTWNKDGMKVEDSLPQITIKCMQDSVDSRITTMLGLYRSALWSQAWRREVVPANLRKFDMGVYIFQSPTHGDSYKTTGKRLQGYSPSMMNGDVFAGCHYFEFHDCEIDPNSIKNGFSSMDNSTGVQMEPSISINYNDCFVSTYNDQLCRSIGDFVRADLDARYDALDFTPIQGSPDTSSSQDKQSSTAERATTIGETVTKRISESNNYTRNTGFNFGTAVADNLAGIAVNTVSKIARKAYLGNVYGASLRQIVGVGELMMSGDVVGAVSRGITVGTNTAGSIKEGSSVVHDTIPSLTGRKDPITLGNVTKGLIRNL